MRKAIFGFAAVAALVSVLLYTGCSEQPKTVVAPGAQDEVYISGDNCKALLAGQTINAGTFCIAADNANGCLRATYSTTGGWQITEVHLWAGSNSISGCPQTPGANSNPIPGQFPYSSFDGEDFVVGGTTWTRCIPFSVFGVNDPEACGFQGYFAAHAVLRKQNANGTWRTETAWGDGTRFTTRGNWATYSIFNFSCRLDPPAFSCHHSDATSVTLEVAQGGDHTPEEYVVQYAEYSGADCENYVWAGSPHQVVLAADQPVTVTGLACGTQYVFRVKSRASGFEDSRFSPSACCVTDLCPPALSCGDATDNSVTLAVSAGGGAGAPAGIHVADNFGHAWDVVSGDTIQATGYDCGTQVAFTAYAAASAPYGQSDNATQGCSTTGCPAGPLDPPSAACGASEETGIGLSVTAGASGAPSGFGVQYSDNAWNTYGEQQFAAGAPVLIEGLDCHKTYAIRVYALAAGNRGASDFSAAIQCNTGDCPCTVPGNGFWRNGSGRNYWDDEYPTFTLVGTASHTVTNAQAMQMLQSGNTGCQPLGRELMIAVLNNVILGAPLPACYGAAVDAYFAGGGCSGTQALETCLHNFSASGSYRPNGTCPSGF
jgi:hypothetical protein